MAKWLFTATKCNWLEHEFSIQSHASPSNCCPGQWDNLCTTPRYPCPLTHARPWLCSTLSVSWLTVSQLLMASTVGVCFPFFCTSTARLQCVLCLCVYVSHAVHLPSHFHTRAAAAVQTTLVCLKRFPHFYAAILLVFTMLTHRKRMCTETKKSTVMRFKHGYLSTKRNV